MNATICSQSDAIQAFNAKKKDGLSTDRDRRKGEAVAPEDVVIYFEGAATMALG